MKKPITSVTTLPLITKIELGFALALVLLVFIGLSSYQGIKSLIELMQVDAVASESILRLQRSRQISPKQTSPAHAKFG